MELMTEERKGFKKTDVGLIPEDWGVKSLGDVLTVKHGKSQKAVESEEGKNPILGTGGLIGRTNSYLYDKPSVLIGRKGTIDKPRYIETPFWTVDTLFYTIIEKGYLAKYIYYYFNLIDWYSYNEASGVPSLNSSTIEGIRIPLPPTLEEQQAIASALNDVDELIRSLDGLIQKKQAIKKGTMQQLLTGKKRLSGFDGEWEEYELGDLGNFKNGINKSKDAFGHGSPFVNLMDVFGIRSINQTKHLKLVDSNSAEQSTYDLKKGDVLFVRSSVKPSGVGLTTLVEEDLPNTVYSGFLIRFRDDGELNNVYKAYCFHETSFRNRLIAKSSVSANTNINQESLKVLKIKIPPSQAEQKAIAQILSDMDQELQILRQKREKYVQIKQGMMQELLTGKVRLV